MKKQAISLAAIVGGCGAAEQAAGQTPGVTFDFDGLNLEVSEDLTSDRFSVVLDSEPTDPVQLNFSVSDPTEAVLLSGAMLTFFPGNWDREQFVSVVGLDDQLQDGDIAFLVTTDPLVSDDLSYGGLDVPDIPIINFDNEPIPEPATALLVGLGGFVLTRRRSSVGRR